jgi:type IV pilus assembly protein PilQ
VRRLGGAGATVSSVQFKDVVLQLDVTPIVSPDGRIMMEVELKRDTVGTPTPMPDPTINTKEVKTKIIVEDGQTIVIGGVIDEQNKTEPTREFPAWLECPFLNISSGKRG